MKEHSFQKRRMSSKQMIDYFFVLVDEFICSKILICLSRSDFKLPKFDSNFRFLLKPRVCRSSSGAARSEN